MKKLLLSTAILIGFSVGTVHAEQGQTLGDAWNSFTNSVQNFVNNLGKNNGSSQVQFKPNDCGQLCGGFSPFDSITAKDKNKRAITDTCPYQGYEHFEGGGTAGSWTLALCPTKDENNPYATDAQWLYYSQDGGGIMFRKGESCHFQNKEWRCAKWIPLKSWETHKSKEIWYDPMDNPPNNWNMTVNAKPSKDEKGFNLISVTQLSGKVRTYQAWAGKDKISGAIDCGSDNAERHVIKTINGKAKNEIALGVFGRGGSEALGYDVCQAKPTSVATSSVKKLLVGVLPKGYGLGAAGCGYYTDKNQNKEYCTYETGQANYWYFFLNGKLVKLKELPHSSKKVDAKFQYQGYTITLVETGKTRSDEYSSATPMTIKVEGNGSVQNIKMYRTCGD